MTGFLTLIEREYYRFFRMAVQTLVPPVIMTFLFVIIFGYSLGGQIEQIEGVSYIVYILPGLASMGAITNSYSNSSSSLYMARMDRSIENILVAPLSSFRIVVAFVIGGMTRGVVIGGVTLFVASIATSLHVANWPAAIFYLALIAMIFSSLGVVSALWAEDWDHLATFSNFVLTPLTYLGGVFYSVKMLPGIWKHVASFNPLFYFINGVRRAVLGFSDLSYGVSAGVTIALTLCSVSFAVVLFKRGYKLIV